MLRRSRRLVTLTRPSTSSSSCATRHATSCPPQKPDECYRAACTYKNAPIFVFGYSKPQKLCRIRSDNNWRPACTEPRHLRRAIMTYDNDIEERGRSGSRTPLLGSSSHQRIGQESDDHKWTLKKVLQFFGGGIYAPDSTTYDPLEILLNTEDEEEQDELTTLWRDNKLSELNFVGVVVSLGRILFPWFMHLATTPFFLTSKSMVRRIVYP
jgi:hypothetical protein